jgi:hypothetical protein
MQPTDPVKQAEEESFNKAVEDYRLGGRQEKNYIPDNSSAQDPSNLNPVEEFDPTAFLQQTPQTPTQTPPSGTGINFSAQLNPFNSPTAQDNNNNSGNTDGASFF